MREVLAAHADPERALATQAYMKSTMPYRGVRLPIMRDVLRPLFADASLDSFDEWRETVLGLWDGAAYREERYAALHLLGDRRYRAYQTLAALPLYTHLIVSGAWWDLVDDVATHRVGDLLRWYHEPMQPVLLAWAAHDDHWLRRTSIVCQGSLKAATDEPLLWACIEPSLGEKDFFLRKGIGWALREYSKTAPQAVRLYVAEHEARLSLLSKREALRLLPQ